MFEDYAISSSDQMLCFGRVSRMRKKGKSRGMIEYVKPISFSDDLRDIYILYQEYENKSRTSYQLSPKLSECRAATIIPHVNLTYDSVNDLYNIDSEELNLIEESLKKKIAKSSGYKKTKHYYNLST